MEEKKKYIYGGYKKIKGQSTNKARRQAGPAPLQEWGGVSSGKKRSAVAKEELRSLYKIYDVVLNLTSRFLEQEVWRGLW